MEHEKAVARLIEYSIHFGIVGGSLTLVWYLIKKMVNDLSAQFGLFTVKVNLALDNLRNETEKRFRENSTQCMVLREGCMVDREVLKKEYLTESLHKIVCKSTQRDLKLHVSDENKLLLREIQSNKEAVVKLISDLRDDLRENGAVK